MKNQAIPLDAETNYIIINICNIKFSLILTKCFFFLISKLTFQGLWVEHHQLHPPLMATLQMME